jgi:hypothetical protein
MKKAIFYFVSAICYVIFIKEFAEPFIMVFLGNSRAAHLIYLFLIALLPMIILMALSVTSYQDSRNKGKPEAQRETRNYNEQLWAGDIAMNFAFWGYYLTYTLFAVVVVPFALSKLLASPTTQEKFLLPIALIAVATFQVLAAMGVWRSSLRYGGRRLWAILTRIAVVSLLVLIVFEFIYFILSSH